MPDPKPSPAFPFPLEAFAHERARAREMEKRSLWKGLLTLLKSHDVVERAGFCPVTLLGLVVLFVRMLDAPGLIAEAHALGLAEAEGFAAPEAQPKTVPLQLVASTEPEPALLARLSAEGFCRMTAPGVEPVIFLGHGSLANWKAAQTNGLRITKVDLPGGTIRGVQILVEGGAEGEGAGPASAPETGTGGAGSAPAASVSTDDAPGTRAAVPGAEAGRTEAAAGAAAARKTRGAPAPRTRKAVSRRSPVNATTGSSVRPYRWAEISAPAGQPDWTLHRATDAEREALMLAAVTAQGPVDLDTATEAVRLGLKMRAILTHGRTRLKEALDRLEADGVVIRSEDGYYDLPGRPVLSRDRTGCDERLRRLASLPPVEVDAAIREVLAAGGPAAEADVMVGAAGRLGYPLKSPATNPALAGIIARRIAVLVEAPDQPVIRGADGLGLAPPPADRPGHEDRADDGARTDGAVAGVDPDGGDPGGGDPDDGAADDQPPMPRAAE